MHDSGLRVDQETGAQCDPSHMDAAMELLSPYTLYDLATWLGKGAKKYAPRNWEKGIPFSVCVGKLQRHLQQYIMGKTDEDHLSAVGFWYHALAHYRAMIKRGLLPAELDDLPRYEAGGESIGLHLEDNQREVYRGFIIESWGNLWASKEYNPCGWFAQKKNSSMLLHKDLILDKKGTGYYKGNYGFGEAPGYYHSKAEAKYYIDKYLDEIQQRGWVKGISKKCEPL